MATAVLGNHGEAVALLEAKKKFKVIRNGRPVITDKVLGQMVGEALALRLSLPAQPLHDYEEDVVVIAAARQHMCFLSVHIPGEYVQQAQSPDNHLGSDDEFSGRHNVAGGGVEKEPVITISATDWLNLAEQHSRKIARENITTLVHWQQEHWR
ncbi:hypothetical protein B0T14DRAFT_560538 [Immersiella caudata]|uniref:Uncharacterized protein n=1 Tax=Immersiella caudata TaxID=314043 RepID=A0AA39XFA0_9PEZI|nr:hypothetical protein B0T14DRAFT_560538 [Immersiella caudata]